VKAGWSTQTLSEVCQIRPPKSEARARLKDSDSVSFAPMEDLGINQKLLAPKGTRALADVAGSYTYFADGDVLLAKITPCFENGKLGIAANLTNGIGFGSSEYIVFRPNSALDRHWLYYFLCRETFREEGAARMSGAVGHKRVAKEFIDAYPIPVPPLPEQQRIVGILDEAFDGIATAKANAEKNLQNARALFESHLQTVFSEAWTTSELVTLTDLATDITDGDHMPPPKAATGVPFITIGNIEKDTRMIDFVDTFMVPQDYFDRLKPNKKPRIGDVLYTVTGSFGVPVLVSESREFCFQRHIGLVRPKTGVDSKWLYYLLMSPQVFAQANDGATGTAQKTVSLKVLRGYVVPRISFAVQRTVAAKLDALIEETQRLESLYQRKLTALDELKKSLLHQAFSGAL
jgi:type I restriction enzyme, S subunit